MAAVKQSYTVRLSLADLATILRYYKSKGIVLTTKAQLIDTSIKHLATALVDSEKVEPFSTEEEAVEYLESSGLGVVKTRAVMESLKNESLKLDSYNPVEESSLEMIKKVVKEAIETKKEK